MKKKLGLVYIILCFLICLVPFAGMTFWATNSTTENKTLAELPSVMEDGELNLDFLQDLGAYFEDHFAFREAFVNADAEIQSKVFQVSNVDTVINGEDGWLYYSATLDDYLGQDLLSDRSIYNAAYNLSVMQDYVESEGARFAVTIAPNKNSLYGEHMPYYDSYKVSNEKNVENLQTNLEELGVTYVDLFQAFEDQDEVLYLKRDSHWNEKGAVLAYNQLLDSMEIDHDRLETVTALRTKTEVGDLNTMVFPLTAQPEWNYDYEYDSTFKYVTDDGSDEVDVEDAWIVTENPEGEGSLLMFRDSFGNTLLPLMANTFDQGYFSRGVPYSIQFYMETYEPETVICEKVERNIDEFCLDPPVMQSMEQSVDEVALTVEDETTCTVEEAEADTSFWCISGVLDESGVDDETTVLIRLSVDADKEITEEEAEETAEAEAEGEAAEEAEPEEEITVEAPEKFFDAFLVTTGESDYGYMLYLNKSYVTETFGEEANEMDVSVITETDGTMTLVHTETVNLAE